MEIRPELKYTKDHEWVKVEGNQAIIGITDYAQGELGDIVYVEIEALGEELQKEEIKSLLTKYCSKNLVNKIDDTITVIKIKDNFTLGVNELKYYI